MKEYTFRASSIGKLMTGVKKPLDRLTDLQREKHLYTFPELEANKKLTPAKEKEWNKIKEKLNAPLVLSETAKDYCMDVFLKTEYEFEERISTKQMRKGIKQENTSLKLLSKHIGKTLFKNEIRNTDPLIPLSGEHDAMDTDGIVYDVKTSWSPKTFMKADLKHDYEWQLRAYMKLTGAKKAVLAYCLVDMSADEFQDMERREMWQKEVIDPSTDAGIQITEELTKLWTYENNPLYKDATRVKWYVIHRDKELEDLMTEQIINAKEYYNTLTLNHYPDESN